MREFRVIFHEQQLHRFPQSRAARKLTAARASTLIFPVPARRPNVRQGKSVDI
jgi:hypothetical protein